MCNLKSRYLDHAPHNNGFFEILKDNSFENTVGKGQNSLEHNVSSYSKTNTLFDLELPLKSQ